MEQKGEDRNRPWPLTKSFQVSTPDSEFKDWAHLVEKLQFSFSLDLLFIEISNSLNSFCDFPKDCLFTYVSFTAYENFYKLSKMHSLLIFPHFPSIRSIRNQKLHNQTYIHLYTDSSIHKYICGSSLSGDLLSIIIPF